jgi:WhiB family redox-sensing transcriptional regulator
MQNQHQTARGPEPSAGREDWRPLAACRFTDPDLFFPLSERGHGVKQAAAAKAICAGCAVRRECLAFALRTRQVYGIWGGMTERERYPARNAGQPERTTVGRDRKLDRKIGRPRERASTGAVPCAPGAEVPGRGRLSPIRGRVLTEAQTIAASVACGQLTGAALAAVRDSVQQASGLPARTGWERKATAHAEIFRLLAETAGEADELAMAGLIRELILTVGPVADGMIISSRQRLLARLGAGDAAGAAVEMEGHLRVLFHLGRLSAMRRMVVSSG